MINRREFIASQSALGLTFLSDNFCFSNPEDNGGSKSVIYLFLSGGCSHIESFNPVPNAPVEVRSTTGHIQTSIPGEVIGGNHLELSKRTDRVAIVRSFGHVDSNHRSAQHLNLTGGKVIGDSSQTTPSFGSCSSYKYGPNSDSGLPNYVQLNSHPHTKAASLGQKFAGYESSPDGLGDLSLKITLDHLNRRRKILNVIEESNGMNKHQIAKDYADLREQAINSLVGNISEVFKMEGDKQYDSFSGSPLGKDLLRSIRLVEAGCKFIFLTTGGWDLHSNIKDGMTRLQLPLDLYISKMIDSLRERGLDKDVLFVVSSEFGRTYKVNVNAGRDHNPRNIPLLFSCSSYDMGKVIGKTNDTASEVTEDPYGPEDLTRTILEHLEFRKGERWTGVDGRPHDFINNSAKNILT